MKSIKLKETLVATTLFILISFSGIVISHFLKFNLYLYFTIILITSYASVFVIYKYLITESITPQNALSFSVIFASGDVFFKSVRYFHEINPDLDTLLSLSFLSTIMGAIYVLKKN